MREIRSVVAVVAGLAVGACGGGAPASRPLSSAAAGSAAAGSPYARLFVEGACFRYRVVHRARAWDEDRSKLESDTSRTAEIRCCVETPRRIAQATAARVGCESPRGFDEGELTGNPPITPVVPAARVYVMTPAGLWSAADRMPATAADVLEITNDPQARLFARPARELDDKNVEDEDVSYTTQVQRDDQGRWCWERVERDDYKIVERLCFADGTMVHSERIHEVDESLDTTTLELIE